MKNSGELNFVFKTSKKNHYVRLKEGAYPREFRKQVREAIAALEDDDLGSTKMVRQNKRSGIYEVTMGFGKRNWWFENNYIARGHVAPFETAAEAMEALRAIRKAAKAGEFDEALEALRIQRQDHAGTMLENKEVCGFHGLPAPDPVPLLEAPKKFLPPPDGVPA